MTLIPYLPNPYPDEIFGSWLRRISIYNGKHIWKQLCKDSGYPGTPSGLFDFRDGDPRLTRLLESLGLSYHDAIVRYTTFPFWLAYDGYSLRTHGNFAQNSAYRRLRQYLGAGDSRVPVGSLRTFGLRPSIEGLKIPKFCPACLSADIEEHGESYWHRAHQLAISLVCFRHGSLLRSFCPGCGAAAGQIVPRRLIGLPPIRCKCGCSLATPTYAPKQLPPAFIKMAVIANSALSNSQTPESPFSGREYLRERIATTADGAPVNYQRILCEAYAVSRAEKRWLVLEDYKSYGLERPFRLMAWLSAARAPEYCAVLAALGIPFRDPLQATQSPSEEIKSRLPTSMAAVEKNILTIQSARRMAVDFTKGVRGASSRNAKLYKREVLYWFLWLNDAEWMRRNFPKSRPDQWPTLQKDRKKIKHALQEALRKNLPCAEVRRHAYSTFIRAEQRDEKWVEAQLRSYRASLQLAKERMNKEKAELHAQVLDEALTRILATEERPVRIYPKTLARYAGLSIDRASAICRGATQLSRRLDEINRDRARRTLQWAARRLIAEDLRNT